MIKRKFIHRKLRQFLLASVLFGGTGSAMAQVQFAKEYNLDFEIFSTSIYEQYGQHFEQRPGGYAISGPVNGEYSKDPCLVTINPNGNLGTLSNRYGIEGSDERQTHLTYISSGNPEHVGYLLTGTQHEVGGLSPQGLSNYLIKTNLNGHIQWTKKISIENDAGVLRDVMLTGVNQVSSGKVILTGFLPTGTAGTHDEDLVVIRLDPSNGNIDWYEIYNSEDFGRRMHVLGFEEGEPGNYYFFGESENGADISFVFRIVDGIFTPLSEELHYLNMPYNSQPGNRTFRLTSLLFDGESLVYGGDVTSYVSGISSFHVAVFKTDADFSNIRSLDNTPNVTSAYKTNSLEDLRLTHMFLQDGNIVLTGQIWKLDGSGNSPGFCALIHPNGNMLNMSEGNANMYANYSTNGFSDNGKFLKGENTKSNSYRVTSYSAFSNTCDDIIDNENMALLRVGISELSFELYPREMLEEELVIDQHDQLVEVTEICSQCPEVLPAEPIITSTGSTTFCPDMGYTLTAPAGYVSYAWYLDGDIVSTAASFEPTAGGEYLLVAYTAEGCDMITTITLTMIEGCVIDETFPDYSYCSLKDGGGYKIPKIGWTTNPLPDCDGTVSYSWSYNGDLLGYSGYSIPFQGVGNYQVVVTTPCGTQVFTQYVSDDLVIEINCLDAKPSYSHYDYVGGVQHVFFTVSPFGTYDQIKWTFYNSTTGVTTIAYGTTASAPYTSGSGDDLSVTVEMINIDECYMCRDVSNWNDGPESGGGRRTALTDVEDETLQGESIKLEISAYPNPTNGNLTIEINDFNENVDYQMTVLGMDGKVLEQLIINQALFGLDMSAYQSGNYIISINGNGQIEKVKITKM